MNVPRAIGRIWVPLFVLAFLVVGCNLDTATPSPTVPPPTTTPEPQPTPTATPTATPTPFHPSVEIIGEEEIVYDWTTDRCGEKGSPDLPVRAFRDAEGMVQLNLSSPVNYRMIGQDLSSLQVDCEETLVSDMDTDPSQYNFLEWVGATYTLDGETVYALIHNEFHGDEASTWDALRDFDLNQGANGWTYQGWDGAAYSDMQFNAAIDRWQGEQTLCQIGAGLAHPGQSCESALGWTSPVTGVVRINGTAADADPDGGDGVTVSILKGSEELWSVVIENGDTEGQRFDLEVSVQEGDVIYFRVNKRGNTDYDTTILSPEINVGPDPCDPDQYCAMISLTYAESTDGGRTFTQPEPPNHLVANLPYRYEPNWGLVAIWQPSNIVQSPHDGYYYALIQLDINRTGEEHGVQGTCVMRTMTLDDPVSWRAWDGEGFNMRFVNPYEEPEVDPEAHTCQLVSPDEIGALTYNLTYNTYYNKFLAVGHGVNNVPTPGFYFALSDDLIHWTPKQLLMATDLAQTTDGPFLAYPSLIDADNTSLNYDVTGQRPYLYYSRFQSRSLIDVDLLRVRIEFDQ